jgi:hypothetical protein
MFAPTKTATAPKARKPKAPGPVAQKLTQLGQNAIHLAWPYAASLGAALLFAAVTGQGWIALMTLGGVISVAGLRLHEGFGWHRKGGRAAARKRRKYQGPASRREIQARLSYRAIQKRAHVTRPAMENPRKLPPEELGVLIGESVRRQR